MKILYYHWMENVCSDCVASMREQGHDVEIYSEKMENYTRHPVLRCGYPGGGFCITNYQAEDFQNGVELGWFEDREDLMAKTDDYLTHESERERIAVAGHKAVAKSFTYEQLLPKILRI